MHTGRTVFAQLMDFMPMHEFNHCVQHYEGNWRVRDFSCLNQFLCMAFAQLTGCESLREIVTRLGAMQSRLYHSGFRGAVARSTLADANEHRDWQIYRDFAHVLINIARPLYANDSLGVDLKATAYVLDSTVIELCQSLFPWAKYQHDCGAVKLHTLIDLRGNIPCWVYVSDGKTHDVNALDRIVPEPGAFYIMDRGYVDYARLARIQQNLSFFIVRARDNLACRRGKYRPVDRSTGLRSDYDIKLRIARSAERYPQSLRRISYYDSKHHYRLILLTNHFELEAIKVAQLYKRRWQVELFFKWIKQHLRIKSFFGTSKPAVKTQVWIAISTYVLMAIMRKRLKLERSLAEIQQILGISLFEQVDISQLLTENRPQSTETRFSNQLKLWDF